MSRLRRRALSWFFRVRFEPVDASTRVGFGVLAASFVVASAIGAASRSSALASGGLSSAPGPTEVTSLRTATSDTFLNPDGSYDAQVHSGPINFRPALGSWQPIDSRLLPEAASGFSHVNGANSFSVQFADHASGDYSEFDSGDGPVSLSLLGVDQSSLAAAPAAVTDSDRGELVYPDVEAGVNLVYQLTPLGVKEAIVLKNASAPPDYSFQLTPKAGQQLTARKLSDGGFGFFESGATAPTFRIAAPVVTESLKSFLPAQCTPSDSGGPPICAGAPPGPPPGVNPPTPAKGVGVEDGSDAVSRANGMGTLTVARDQGGFRVDFSVDEAWLSSSARVFPVVLDPTVILSGSSEDQDGTFESDCGSCTPTMSSSSTHVQVGGDGTHVYEAASLFNLSSIPPGSAVLSGVLTANFDSCFPPAGYSPGGNGCTWVWPYQSLTLNAHRITTSWNGSTTTSSLGVDSTVLSALPITLGYPGVGIGPGTPLTWDLTPQVQQWISGAEANDGVVLQETDMCGGYSSYCGINIDDSQDSTPSLRPFLSIEYEPRLGSDSRWPMWSNGPLAVNETTGNLVIAAPTPSFPTAAGTLSVPITFNELDPSTTNHPLGAGWTIGATTWLIDHAAAGDGTGIDVYSGDRSSVLYTLQTGANVYQATDGSNSTLTKNTDGTYTLIGGDGSIASYGAANSAGVAEPTSLQTLASSAHTGEIDASFDGSGRLQLLKAVDGSTVIAQLAVNWNGVNGCTQMVCIVGPDGQTWTYTADGSGRLQTVNDGTRNVLKITYDGSSRPQTIQNADDLASGTHNLTIGYDSQNRVGTITSGPISGQTPSSSTWSFAYHPDPGDPSMKTPDAPAVTHGSDIAGTQLPAAGYTTITPPCEQATGTCAGHSGTATESVYYDSLGYPLEKLELPGENNTVRHTLDQYSLQGQLLWTEDEDGNPTDYSYDPVDGTLLSITRPDPDGGGPSARPVTIYHYDETAYGSVSGSAYTPGPALQGLQADYYRTKNFVSSTGGGRPDAIETDLQSGSFSFAWGATGPPALYGSGTNTNYSVSYIGDLTLASAETWYLGVQADSGAELVVDGDPIISNLGGSGGNLMAGPYALTAGKHRIVVEYAETNASPNSNLTVGWCDPSASNCSSWNSYTAFTSSALPRPGATAPQRSARAGASLSATSTNPGPASPTTRSPTRRSAARARR